MLDYADLTEEKLDLMTEEKPPAMNQLLPQRGWDQVEDTAWYTLGPSQRKLTGYLDAEEALLQETVCTFEGTLY